MTELLSYIDSSTYPMVISCFLLYRLDKTLSDQKQAFDDLSDEIKNHIRKDDAL